MGNQVKNEGAIIIHLTVPPPWPPKTEVIIFQGEFDGAQIKVTALPSSRLRFSCSHLPNDSITQELRLQALTDLKVGFTWDENEDVGIGINGNLIRIESTLSEEPINIVAPVLHPTGLREQLVAQPLTGVSIEEERFICSVFDLQNRINTASCNDLLEASAILRRLLLDARPLAHLANQQYKIKLGFPVLPEKQFVSTPQIPTYTHTNLSPLYSNEVTERLSLGAFLTQTVVKSANSKFTVRDVVDLCANIKGGIHFGKPKTESEEELLTIDKHFNPSLIEASLYAIADLSWCVIQGLKPLIDAIAHKNALPKA